MSNVEQELEHKAMRAPPGSLRQSVLLAARRFKASWVELGKLLSAVKHEGTFQEWGYATFDAYCLGELRIRKQTADKLTRGYSVMNKYEPERLQQPDVAEAAPPFEVVEVLAQAEERGQLSAQEYRSIRDAIWSQEKPTSELRKELIERFPPPDERAPSDAQSVKRLWLQMKRLAAELKANKKVPRAVAERADALVDDLEAVVTSKADA
ncbi:MAG: hypothetical protein INH41_30585 [Myxococcaceae bacterium]|nr:hypothetical protein [Myxococcaceae bacterium]MCA3016753.1 hypothetical protein [Myxococcaceae bacterium]